VKKYNADLLTRTDKMADAREMCLTRLRTLPREKREAAADALLALADPHWGERGPKGGGAEPTAQPRREARRRRGHADRWIRADASDGCPPWTSRLKAKPPSRFKETAQTHLRNLS